MLVSLIPGHGLQAPGTAGGTDRTRSSFLVSIVRDPLAPIPLAEHADE
jgi:hypothetical protein